MLSGLRARLRIERPLGSIMSFDGRNGTRISLCEDQIIQRVYVDGRKVAEVAYSAHKGEDMAALFARGAGLARAAGGSALIQFTTHKERS